jgi:hypothetical protein
LRGGDKVKISEYRLLSEAYEKHFGFALNRVEEEFGVDLQRERNSHEGALDRCFNEFMVAFDEMGVELGDAEVPHEECRCHVGRRYAKDDVK